MFKRNLRSLCAFMGMLVVLLATNGCSEAKTRLKLYALYPEDSFITQGLFAVAERVKEGTNGEINIKVFPSGQLAGYEEAFEEVRLGTIECGVTYLTKRYDPRLGMPNLPGLASTGYEEFERVFFSKKSPFLKKIDAILEELGMVSLGPWPEPFPGLVFREGKRPGDLLNFGNRKANVRVPGMPLYRDAYKAMGYQTATIAWAEVFSALQTGQVDGSSGVTAETAYLVAKDMIKYYDANNAESPPGWFIMNKEVWESFTKEQQDVIVNAINIEGKATLAKAKEMEHFYFKKLQESGVEVITYSDEDLIALGAHLRKTVWPNYYDDFGEDFLKELDAYIMQK